MLLCCPFSLYALPEVDNVAEGEVNIETPDSATLNITTLTDKAIINYRQFNIAQNETVRFIQPSLNSSALNRDLSGIASQILGNLFANGSIILINPAGINIGPTANINAASIIASTLDISNADFLNGNYKFFKNGGNAFLFNQGNIIIRNGGYVALLSGGIENSGKITAELGTVVLASGEAMTLALDDLNEISVVIDEAVQSGVLGFDNAIKNSGAISANGGKVILTAKVLNAVFDYAINNSGVIEAKAVVNHNGVVELIADGAPVINTGKIEAGQVNVIVKDADFINKGEIVTQKAEPQSQPANISIQAVNVLQGGLISAQDTVAIAAETVTVILKDNPDTMLLDPLMNVSPGVIIQANQVRISAKQFGSINAPLNINAALTYINRTQGDINILDSLGIGTSIMLRGPPDGFGAIIYNKNTHLNLETQKGSISEAQGVSLSASNLSLIANQNINISGTLQGDYVLLRSINGDTILKSGSLIDVSGAIGGRVEILGNRVGLIGAQINASGISGGGTVLIGGNFQGKGPQPNALRTYVSQDTVINADALINGNGGKVIVWSDEATWFYGSISARGGANAGDGGFVEVSGKNLVFKGSVDLGAPNGLAGTLLLDPAVITITSGTADGTDDEGTTTTLFKEGGNNTVTFEEEVAADPFIIYESELEGTNADMILEARNSIGVSGTFTTGLVLKDGKDLTLRTRNDTGEGSGGIDLVTGATGFSITTSGNGKITIKSGTDGDDAGSAPINLCALTTASGKIDVSAEGILTLNGNISTDSGDVSLTGDIRLGTSVTIDTEQGNNGAGGDVTLAGAGMSATATGYDLSIDTSTTNNGSDGGKVLLTTFSNAGSKYVEDLTINTSAGTGGATGRLTLNGNISTDSGDVSLTGDIRLGTSVTIDTEQGNNGAGGSVILAGTGVSATATGQDLTINTSTTNNGSNGGAVSLTTFSNAGSKYVEDLTINTSAGTGGTAGALTLNNNISLDGRTSDSSSITLTGGGDVIISSTLTIDTEQGNNNGVTGGAVNFGNSNIYADAADYTLTINTGNSNFGETGGAVTIGLVDNNAGGNSYLSSFSITTTGAGTDGVITLNGDVSTTTSITINNAVNLGSNDRTFTSNEIDFLGGNNSISGTGNLTLQPSANNVSIGIAGGAGILDLSTTDIAALQDGFSGITIGRAAGEHTIIINAITFNDPVIIQTPNGGSITVSGLITGSGDASVTLDGSGGTTTLNANIVTNNQNIHISDSVVIGQDKKILLSTQGGGAGAGDISIDGNTEGTAGGSSAETLTLNAGTGTVTFGGYIHGSGGGFDSYGLIDLTITNVGTTNFSGPIAITGALTQTNTATGTTTFSDTVSVGSTTLRGTSYNVNNSFVAGDPGGSSGIIDITNSGLFTKGATGDIRAKGGFSASGNVSLANNITTTNTLLSIGGTLTIADGRSVTLSTQGAAGAGNITISGVTTGTTTGSAESLTLNAGTGTINVAAIYGSGTSADATGLTTVTVTNISPAVANFNGAVKITGTFTKQGTGDVSFGSSSFTVGGLTLSGGTLNNAPDDDGTWDINGTVSIVSGTLKATSSNFYVSGDWTNSGTFDPNGGTVTFDGDGEQYITSGESSFYNLVIANISDDTVYLQDALDVDGNLTIEGDSALDAWEDEDGNPNDITIAGDWDNQGEFIHNENTVTFNGTSPSDSDITGNNTFWNLTIDTTDGAKTVRFGAGQTQVIVNTLVITGASGKVLTIRSTIGGTQATLDIPASIAAGVNYVDVKDNKIADPNTITPANSTNSLGNTNWIFNQNPNLPDSLGPANLVDGNWTNDNTSTFNFNLSDNDAGQQVRFQLQIDDNADFGSLVADYTSALGLQGSFSFTVGQAAVGSGAYTTGSEGQTLGDSGTGYYWRVRAIDSDGALSGWQEAGVAGTVDFKVDTVAPTITGAATPVANANGWNNTNVTVSYTVNDALSGIDDANPLTDYADDVLANEGANQSATGTVYDQAGNSATATVNNINIDKTAPVIDITAPTNGTTYDTAQTLLYTTADLLSGIGSVVGPASGTVYNTLGTHSILITATDLAGNSTSVSLSFTIEMATFTESQLSNATVFRLLLPSLEQLAVYRFNTFTGAVYFYHPLIPTDMAAFDQFILEEGAYELIEGAINIIGHEGLLDLLRRR